MNYQETVNWIFEKLPMYQRIGAAAYKANLDNTHLLMQMTGNPHEGLKCIHIAGTNGKGSVSHMLASILQESGLKTGLYTSPHLFDYRERMRINGMKIPKDYVTSFMKKYMVQIEQISPSFFEISVALAFSWFRDEKTDVVVIETGMGGRLDSTNVVSPLLSIITNIGLDHTQFLGETHEMIAAEKAGIIKSHVPVLIGEGNPVTLPVFKKVAKKLGAKLKVADEKAWFHKNDACTQCLRGNVLRKGKLRIANIQSPLHGVYQMKNIVTVVEACRLMKMQNIPIRKRHVRNGIQKVIQNTGFAGRWEVFKSKPTTICDVAHNNEGLRIVFSQLMDLRFNTLHIVIGVNNDKNLDDLFQILPQNAEYYFCKANVPRGMDAAVLSEAAQKSGLNGKAYPSVAEAYRAAIANAHKEKDLIFAGGSTFVVAEIPPLIKKYLNDE